MNSTTTTRSPKEAWLNLAGSYWATDIINLYILTPVIIIGFFANLAGFLIIQTSGKFRGGADRVNHVIYVYLKFIFLAGSLYSLVGTPEPFIQSRRLVSVGSTYFGQYYSNQIEFYLQSSIYFGSNVIYVLISIEKLRPFVQIFDKLARSPVLSMPNVTSILIYFVCSLINLPCYFYFRPFQRRILNDTYSFYFYTDSDFGKSRAGQSFQYIQFALRDIIPCVLLIFFNLILLWHIKKFIKNKLQLVVNKTTPSGSTSQVNSLELNTSIMVLVISSLCILRNSINIYSMIISFGPISYKASIFANVANYINFTINSAWFFVVYIFDKNLKKGFKTILLMKTSSNTVTTTRDLV